MKNTLISILVSPMASIPLGLYFGATTHLDYGDSRGDLVLFFLWATPLVTFVLTIACIPVHFLYKKLGVYSVLAYILPPPILFIGFIFMQLDKINNPDILFFGIALLTCVLVPAVFWKISVSRN